MLLGGNMPAAKNDNLVKMRASFDSAFKHDRIETSQGKIAFWDSNPALKKDAPTILLIHGFVTNKEFFDKQLKSPLFANCRLLALDLPGFGESEPPKNPEKDYNLPGFADAVTEFINIMKLTNLVVVGWSLGGHIALELTSRIPQLKGLLITGTPPIEISAAGMSLGFKAVDPRIFEYFGKGNLSYEEAQLLASVSGYDYSKDKEFMVDAIMQTDEGAKTIYPRSLGLGIGQNGAKIVNEWPNPIAVIVGGQEMVINNDYIIHEVKFKNLWENQVHIIPKGGHGVFMEYPHEFNLIMQRFFHDIFNK